LAESAAKIVTQRIIRAAGKISIRECGFERKKRPPAAENPIETRRKRAWTAKSAVSYGINLLIYLYFLPKTRIRKVDFLYLEL